jgi:electron transfer flavoprotein beta subunit
VKVVVLIAGVHDPKWSIAISGDKLPEADADRQIMSPFDEAALEIALRIRDTNPETAIQALVSGGIAGAKIARAVAAFNPAQVSTVAIDRPWDQSAVSETLAQLCRDADLILVGREFGDFDDGLVPPTLAARLQIEFFAQAQLVEAKNGVRFMRENGGFEEWRALQEPMLVSATNDRRTRLRKPLMKNVMLARQAIIANIDVAPTASNGLSLVGVSERSASRAQTSCKWVDGNYEEQAQALVALLREVRT